MNKNIILRNKNYLIIIIACLLLLAPILFVGSYDRPFADDYDYSILTHEVVENGGNVIDIINKLKSSYTSMMFKSIATIIVWKIKYCVNSLRKKEG